MSILINDYITTGGDGLWSRVKKQVNVIELKLGYVNKKRDFGELRVFFDTSTWSVGQDGLIYTDEKFLYILKQVLFTYGLNPTDVSYSEQGMQGVDYVSLDVGKNFLKSWGPGVVEQTKEELYI